MVRRTLYTDLARKKLDNIREANFMMVYDELASRFRTIEISDFNFHYLNVLIESLLFRMTVCPYVEFKGEYEIDKEVESIIASSLFKRCQKNAKGRMEFSKMAENLQNDADWEKWIETL